MNPTVLLISCDHACNDVPDAFVRLFKAKPAVLDSHRAFDFGACTIGDHLAHEMSCDFIATTVTRLLVDTARTPRGKRCFSKFTKSLSPEQQQNLLDHYYYPYRSRVSEAVQRLIDQDKQVLHISIHTFRPVHAGIKRNAGLGVSYDPSRHGEREVARIWRRVLLQQKPTYKVRLNYPFSGKSDSLACYLRRQHNQASYLGLDLEINQILLDKEESVQQVETILANSLRELLQIL